MRLKKDPKALTIFEKIKDIIFNNSKVSPKFGYHIKQIHSFDDLLSANILILTHNLPYRQVNKVSNICWQTVYKFKLKLVWYDIYQELQKLIIDTYSIKSKLNNWI